MFKMFFGIFAAFIQVICFKIFMETYVDKKRAYRPLSKVGILCVFVGMLYITGLITDGAILYDLFITIIVGSAVWWVYFEEDIRKLFSLTVCFLAIYLLQSFMTIGCTDNMLLSYIVRMEQTDSEGMLNILKSKLILFVVVLVIKYFVEKKDDNYFEGRDWLIFSLMPLTTIFAIALAADNIGGMGGKGQAEVIMGLLMGLAAMNVAMFYFGSMVITRERKLRYQSVLRERTQNELKAYQTANVNFEKQKRQMHEFKNQINCIIELAANEKYDELNYFLKQIDDEIRETTDLIDTNNALINAIINSKLREAKEKGITFVIKVNDLSDVGIEDTDMVTLLSNLLNNAIEACEKCKDKLIKFKFAKENGRLIISVVNSMHEPPVSAAAGGRFLTSKTKDKEMHGVGIENIISVINKYKGSYVIEPKGSEFFFSIII